MAVIDTKRPLIRRAPTDRALEILSGKLSLVLGSRHPIFRETLGRTARFLLFNIHYARRGILQSIST
jgi:hypothetical protein